MKDKRLIEMQQYLTQVRVASYGDLCRKFGVSKNTIRSDVSYLADIGFLKKTHGGVALHTEAQVVPHLSRSLINHEGKMAIAKLASELARDNETIFIDSGTTTACLLPFLMGLQNVTIATASMEVITQAVTESNLPLISLGGMYSRHTNSFSGINTVLNLRKINVSKAFLTATCISLENGLSNNSYLEAEIKKAVVEKCPVIIAMLDHTKFDRSATLSFAKLDTIAALVTDKKPDKKYLDYFQENNIPVYF